MMAAIRLWFAALARREQWLIGVAGALTALAVSIFGLLLPILSAVDQAKIDHDEAVQRRGRIIATVDAAVHDDGEALRLAIARGVFVPDAELHPYGRCADGEHVVDDRRDVAAFTEHIDNVGHFGQ